MSQLRQIQNQLFLAGLHQDRDTVDKLMVFCTESPAGDFHYALRIFDYIHEPPLLVYNLMIEALLEKEIQRALDVYKKMQEESKEKPDEATVLDEARDLFEKNPTRDIFLWTAMIKEQEEWIHNYVEENRITEDAEVGKGHSFVDFNYLCTWHECYGGLVEEGRKFFHSMKSTYQIQPKLEHYGCFVDLLGRADRWELVSKERTKMKVLGIKKVPGYTSIEVNGVLHEFIVDDPSHPQMRDIYSMLDAMAKPLMGSKENEMETEILALMNS
ncbi:hypothetical protein L6164_037427 [Bauhinia variegata]|uniref:Uncharacterized protein n=1 Tax=Bauhinia variegata TaxID=167791 RepID=A0ACB9KK67_BAUVA|nr:hypothetical protein L6164_037427 [Bauhinia variegata]